MGIFDFLKKITKEKENEGTKEEKLAFNEIGNWIENKKKEIEAGEKKVFVTIKDRIRSFSHDVEAKINVVKGIDVHSKKAEDRLKSATEDGRDKYLDALGFFIGDLNTLREDSIVNMVFNVDKIFVDFNKISHMSYERATILIGKEMGDLRNEIKGMSRDLLRIFDEHKVSLDISKTISIIEIKLKQSLNIKQDEKRTIEKIAHLSMEILGKEERNKEINEEIEKVKQSHEHTEHLKIMEECTSLKEDLDKDFMNLIQVIDFKALANFYHIFEDKIEIVKSYRDKFRINFEKDNGKEISNLLDISKLNTAKISEKINEINSKREILKTKLEKTKDNTSDLYANIKKNNLESEDMVILKSKEEKRLDKFKTEDEEIFNEIKKEFENTGILLIK